MRRFTLGMMIACFTAMMAFVPSAILAGDAASKQAGKSDIKASSSSDKKDSMKAADKKEKKDAAAKKGAK